MVSSLNRFTEPESLSKFTLALIIKMKIQYASDLHLEFPANRNELKLNQIKPEADILLLAGDIMPFKMIGHLTRFWDSLSKNFKGVYWVPGNHEYYGYDLVAAADLLYKNAGIRDNIFLLNNKVVTLEEVNIICSTMWTHISPVNELPISGMLNDFHEITNNGKRMTVADYNKMHVSDLSFLKDTIEKTKGKKTIVMTHHVPTFLNYPEQYKGHSLNQAFAIELYDFIETSGVKYWIYGHHHNNTANFNLGNTVMLTNQMGYVSAKENDTFRTDAVFEI